MLFLALAARFLLEVALLAVLALWGFTVTDDLLLRLLAGLGAPAAGGLLWGLFIAPKRRFELGRIPRVLLELGLFALAAGALWQMHHPFGGLILFSAACADRFGLIWLRRRALAQRYAGR